MFKIKDLKFKDILDIPDLLIDKQVTCLVGPSGSGKTTLLKMLNGLNIPDKGNIFYNNQDISTINFVNLRRSVVMLGQTPIIYRGDIRDNLLMGLKFSEKPLVLDSVLKDCLNRVGLYKDLEDSCSSLSGGEKQRLCLARVMLMDADTYLLDEPSAALDKDTERFIVENFIAFVKEKNKQLIMVTHSENIVKDFNPSVVVIKSGKVTEVR